MSLEPTPGCLQALGLDLSEFMVPLKDVGPIVGGGNYLTGEVPYT
jgi:hypothetical protein